MVKTFCFALLIVLCLSQFYQGYSFSYMSPLTKESNYPIGSNRLYPPSQYSIFNNGYNINDVLMFKKKSSARDSYLTGAAGEIRRSLKG